MNRRATIAAVVTLLGLPPLFAAYEALSFRAANRNNGSLLSSGVRREYLLHVPAGYDPSTPAPLVISLHGAGGWPAQQRDLTRWNALADRERFLVVYPSAAANGPRVWRAADVGYLSDLIDEMQQRYNIDSRRVFVNGLSNGGGMCAVLSCALAGRVAAVGMVAAAHTFAWRSCNGARPVPAIAFHGTADPIVPYHGGTSRVSDGLFPDIETWMGKWAARNRCERVAIRSFPSPDVTRLAYGHCADGAEVVLSTLRGGGHTWPGGGRLPEWFVGPTSTTVDATAEMWSFFRAHPLPETRAR